MLLNYESRLLRLLRRSAPEPESRNLGLHPAHVALLEFQGHTFAESGESGESDEAEKPGRWVDGGRWFDSLADFWRFRSRFKG